MFRTFACEWLRDIDRGFVLGNTIELRHHIRTIRYCKVSEVLGFVTRCGRRIFFIRNSIRTLVTGVRRNNLTIVYRQRFSVQLRRSFLRFASFILDIPRPARDYTLPSQNYFNLTSLADRRRVLLGKKVPSGLLPKAIGLSGPLVTYKFPSSAIFFPSVRAVSYYKKTEPMRRVMSTIAVADPSFLI